MRLIAAIITAIVIACAPAPASAQDIIRGPVVVPSRWLQGYLRAVSGEVIVYPWAYPGQTRTRLSRATDGRMSVEWDGEAPPPGPPDETVTYLWHAGLASGYGAHRFLLTINGGSQVWFTSGQDTKDLEWTATGAKGVMLSFRTTRVGTFNELFGFMWLTLSRSALGTGAPRFRVVGEEASSQDYFLLPEQKVESWTRARAEEVLLKGGAQALRVEMSVAADTADAAIRLGAQPVWTGSVTRDTPG